ncbi:MAG TPA: NAD(+)/NADH kinase, partial [Blastocatellia bacterium]|nr:NAD(+)/NADH kinase [Blastocatellia bacterium]
MQEAPSSLGIITKPGEPRATELAASIAGWAAGRGINLLVNDRIKQALPGASSASAIEIAEQADLLIVMGGDGTMIATARLVGGRGTPVLGVNLGTLGY